MSMPGFLENIIPAWSQTIKRALRDNGVEFKLKKFRGNLYRGANAIMRQVIVVNSVHQSHFTFYYLLKLKTL